MTTYDFNWRLPPIYDLVVSYEYSRSAGTVLWVGVPSLDLINFFNSKYFLLSHVIYYIYERTVRELQYTNTGYYMNDYEYGMLWLMNYE